jgi:hypothetical protein
MQRERLSLTPEAARAWVAVYPMLTVDHSGAFGAVTARAEAQSMRLALIYALLDGADRVDVLHLRAALAVWDFCQQSARYLFGDVETDPVANRILEALREGERTTTELRDLFRRHISADRLRQALSDLETAGRILKRVEQTSGRSVTYWRRADWRKRHVV